MKKDREGNLSFHSEELKGSFEITDHFILAVCAENLNAIDYQVLKSDPNMNSINVREEIIRFFTKKNKAVKIGSDDLNLPILLPSKSSISISHHNHLGAFAYPKSIIT